MTLKPPALALAALALLLSAAAGVPRGGEALTLGWYDSGYCDDAEAGNPGAPGDCRYDRREDWTGAMCADGVDNDSDEATDCLDSDCPACPTACPKTERDADGDCERDEDSFFSYYAHACANSADDDGNLATDCADPDCADYPACRPEVCRNGLDDDGDGRTDCADDGCSSSGECWACVNSPSPENCDPICVGTTEICGDGIDQDCDGSDTACQCPWYNPWCVGGGPVCGDGICASGETCTADCGYCGDGVCNGGETCGSCAGDCGACDDDCASDADCPSGQVCSGGKCQDDGACGDNQCDKEGGECQSCVEDCGETECQTEYGACDNGVDDDGDGKTDCADFDDCGSKDHCLEERNCADAVDNDLDGDTDCGDSKCESSTDCGAESCFGQSNLCFDGMDNDGDGNSDCNDSGCERCLAADVYNGGAYNYYLEEIHMEDLEEIGNTYACGGFLTNDGKTPYGGVKTLIHGYEVNGKLCSDEADNDGDGPWDCWDKDCCYSADLCPNHRIGDDGLCWENYPREVCDNYEDDDFDGLLDCADDDCDQAAACIPCPYLGGPCYENDGVRHQCSQGAQEIVYMCVDYEPESVPPRQGHWETQTQ